MHLAHPSNPVETTASRETDEKCHRLIVTMADNKQMRNTVVSAIIKHQSNPRAARFFHHAAIGFFATPAQDCMFNAWPVFYPCANLRGFVCTFGAQAVIDGDGVNIEEIAARERMTQCH